MQLHFQFLPTTTYLLLHRSQGVEWPSVKVHGKPLDKSTWSAGCVLLRWARSGRVAGNTLALVGPTGTGKSWIIQLLQTTLGKQWHGRPVPAGSYPLERMGWILPLIMAILLDESSAETFEAWLGRVSWWKQWLDLQTAPCMSIALPSNQKFDRCEFSEPAPIAYSATYPIRLTVGKSSYTCHEKVKGENLQQDRREVEGRCTVYVDRGIDQRLPLCAHCFSKCLNFCQQECSIVPKGEMPSPKKRASLVG